MSSVSHVILVVDDDPGLREAVRLALKKECEVVALPDGEGFLEAVTAYHPDLIVMDAGLPGEDGWRLCRRLKGHPAFSAIPVLFLTAARDAEGLPKALEARGDGYLSKPFRAKALLAAVRRLTQTENAE
jgi:DNA-binding response OmpR family regulator